MVNVLSVNWSSLSTSTEGTEGFKYMRGERNGFNSTHHFCSLIFNHHSTLLGRIPHTWGMKRWMATGRECCHQQHWESVTVQHLNTLGTSVTVQHLNSLGIMLRCGIKGVMQSWLMLVNIKRVIPNPVTMQWVIMMSYVGCWICYQDKQESSSTWLYIPVTRDLPGFILQSCQLKQRLLWESHPLETLYCSTMCLPQG